MAKRAGRTIAVVTGTRAEFGLLTSVMEAIREHPAQELRTIVTGTHLTRGTWREVRDRFGIDARVPMQRRGEVGRAADVAALGRGVSGIGRAIQRLRPDVVLVLGDRIEALAAACAASVGGVRLAHIHGGDRAEGVADEAMRHAISKLAHLHFAATAQSRKRLIRMGERPGQVWRVGSPALDLLRAYRRRGFRLQGLATGGEFMALQHPIGESDARERDWMRQTMRAVERVHAEIADEWPHGPFVLHPNSDPGSEGIRAAIEERVPTTQYNGGAADPWHAYLHLHRGDFLTILASCLAIVGNSSAGLIEAAALRVPCVNVGPRQAGRERPNNVIDCDYGEANVAAALRKALRMDTRKIRHPYGDGRAGERIAVILAEVELAKVPLRKRNVY